MLREWSSSSFRLHVPKVVVALVHVASTGCDAELQTTSLRSCAEIEPCLRVDVEASSLCCTIFTTDDVGQCQVTNLELPGDPIPLICSATAATAIGSGALCPRCCDIGADACAYELLRFTKE